MPMTAMEQFIREYAASIGLNPDIVMRTVLAEGGRESLSPAGYTRQSLAPQDYGQEESYGPFQMHVRGGLGSRALEQGIDPRKPEDAFRTAKFAMDVMAKEGLGHWYGWKGDKWAAHGYTPSGKRVDVPVGPEGGQYNLGPTDPLGAFNTRNPASAMQPPQSISGIGSPSTYATTPRTTPDATATDPYGASSPGGGTGGTQPATGPYEPLVAAAGAKEKKHPLEALGEGIGDAAAAMGKFDFNYQVPAQPGAARVDVGGGAAIDPQQAEMKRQMLAYAMQRLNQGVLF